MSEIEASLQLDLLKGKSEHSAEGFQKEIETQSMKVTVQVRTFTGVPLLTVANSGRRRSFVEDAAAASSTSLLANSKPLSSA